MLGRRRVPHGAAEVTRTGVLHFQRIACPVVSAVIRSWRAAWPDEDLTGIADELGIENV